MHSSDSPPGPPDITENDRAKLRENITALCVKHGVSQRQLEDDIDLSNAFLSKLWKGKVRFTLDILLDICERFACEPLDVVSGTVFTYLLDTAPPSAESDAVRQLREERDSARERAAAAESELVPLREREEKAQAACAAAEARAAASEAQSADLAAEVRTLSAARDAHRAEAKSARDTAAKAAGEAAKAGARADAAEAEARRSKATLDELRRHLDEWKNWATSRDERANFLEQQLRVIEQEYQRVVVSAQLAKQRADTLAQQKHQLQVKVTNAEQGAAVGGGLFGLAAGFLLAAAAANGTSSTPRRRRT